MQRLTFRDYKLHYRLAQAASAHVGKWSGSQVQWLSSTGNLTAEVQPLAINLGCCFPLALNKILILHVLL